MYFPGQLSGACGGLARHAPLHVGFCDQAPGNGGNEGERAAAAVLPDHVSEVALGIHRRQNLAESSKKVPQDGIQHQPITCMMLLFILVLSISLINCLFLRALPY